MKAVGSYECMTDFMIGNPAFLFLPQAAALALRPGYYFFDRIFQITLGDFFSVPPRREQSRLVQQVGQISARESGSGGSDPP
jgi:hypothetical protein